MFFNTGLQPKEITDAQVEETMSLSPRRICFSSYHKDALRKSNNERFLGKFVVPFKESIKPIFEQETGITLFNKFGGYFYSIKIGEGNIFDRIQQFVNKYNEVVFLRDCLDLSIALSENLSEINELTKIGDLEDRAKYKDDKQAIADIADICYNFIINTPYYQSADLICAIPPSDPNNDNLPRSVIRLLKELNEKDISNNVNWNTTKPQLKDLELEKKWLTLNEFELIVKSDVQNKSVILIDDLYQSGTTMQYIGMKLKEAGASLIYGLSFVKARNNKDHV